MNKATNVLSSYIIFKYNAVPLFFFMCDHTRVVSSGKAPKTVGGFVLLFFSLCKVKTSSPSVLTNVFVCVWPVVYNSGVCLGISLKWSEVGKATFGFNK